MKPPSHLKVGPYRYKVTLSPVLSPELGNCNPDTARIVLHPDQPPQVMRETLLHEALHAVTHLIGIASGAGEEQDERLVRRLAPALLDLLRRNPRLVSYLTEQQ